MDPQDYYGEVCTDQVFVHFDSPGVYAIKVDYADPMVTDYIEFLYVNAAPGYTDKFTSPLLHSMHQRVAMPIASPSAFFVEDPVSDNGFIGAAMSIVPKAVIYSSIYNTITNINTAW